MQHFNSFYAINVFTLALDRWDFPVHKHNFFELIYVATGCGTHHLNESAFPYAKGDVFLMTPFDAHQFEIKEHTEFIFVKFTEQVLEEKLEGRKKSRWQEAIFPLMQQPLDLEGSMITNQVDLQRFELLLKFLLEEYKNPQKYGRELLLELFGALMLLVARNLSLTQMPPSAHDDRLNAILAYIRQHIFEPKMTDLAQISKHFLLSPNYISAYVKKHTGLSIQQHLIQHRLKAADILLKQNRLNINQIAEKTGFNDASHFNKLYKKYRGSSPSKQR